MHYAMLRQHQSLYELGRVWDLRLDRQIALGLSLQERGHKDRPNCADNERV